MVETVINVAIGGNTLSVRDFARHYVRAQAEGIHILYNEERDEYLATSGSDPHKVYAVSANGCSCPGFAHRGQCKHLAAFYAALPFLPYKD